MAAEHYILAVVTSSRLWQSFLFQSKQLLAVMFEFSAVVGSRLSSS